MNSISDLDFAVATGHRNCTIAGRLHALEADMKKYITLVMLLALLLGLSALPVVAQMTGIKGVCKDMEGKLITDGVVEITSIETGRKVTVKTGKNGEYSAIGLSSGSYDAVLTRGGQVVDSFNKIPVSTGQMLEVNFDLKKDLAEAMAKSGVTEEQLKKQQEAQKQNEKVKGLNARLAEARDLQKVAAEDETAARQLAASGKPDEAKAKQQDADSKRSQAVTILQEAATSDPSRDLLWAYLGDSYSKAKKYPESIDAYQKALAINANSGAYHNGLADAYAKSGQTEKAVAEFAIAAQVEPAQAGTYYFNEGAIFTNAGKPDEAIAAFDNAIKADPNRADAYYYKGVNLMSKATVGKDGKFVGAPGTSEAFQKYLELKPDGAHAQEAKAMLESLGSSVETTFGKQKAPAKKKP
jgi:tetratricopeptide (TPR) repeat protein